MEFSSQLQSTRLMDAAAAGWFDGILKIGLPTVEWDSAVFKPSSEKWLHAGTFCMRALPGLRGVWAMWRWHQAFWNRNSRSLAVPLLTHLPLSALWGSLGHPPFFPFGQGTALLVSPIRREKIE